MMIDTHEAASAMHERRAAALKRVPPFAPEAEMAVLGAILVEPTCLPKVREVLPNPDWFMRPQNSVIYRAILAVSDAHDGAVDIVLLNQRLEDDAGIKLAGGLDYLVDLARAFPTASHAIHYARLVRDKHFVGVAIMAAGDLIYFLHERADEYRKHLSAAMVQLTEIHKQAMTYAPIGEQHP